MKTFFYTLYLKSPAKFKHLYRKIKFWIFSLPYLGYGKWCPICENSSRKFMPAGIHKRKNARCYFCGSLERHRLIWVFLDKHILNRTDQKILHVAPTQSLRKNLQAYLNDNYFTGDLLRSDVDMNLDITDIHLPNNSLDGIICSHVLEHVIDDRKAMKEFYRVLQMGGWEILLVPISGEKTYEDFSIVDPKDRLRVYGQKDHVRRYGWDFIDRVYQSGFKVTKVLPEDLLTDQQIKMMSVENEWLLFSEK